MTNRYAKRLKELKTNGAKPLTEEINGKQETETVERLESDFYIDDWKHWGQKYRNK